MAGKRKKSSEKEFKIYTYDEIREDDKKFEEVYSFVRRFGRHSISHLFLQPNMNYFVVKGIGFISFMQKRGFSKTVYVLGDAFCSVAHLDSLMNTFFDKYKNVCFLQVSYDFASYLSTNHRYYSNVFGTEALVTNNKEKVIVKERKELDSLKKDLEEYEKEKDELYEKISDDEHKKKFWKVKSKVHKLRKRISSIEPIVLEKESKFFVDNYLSKNQMRFLRREYGLGKKSNLSVTEVTSHEEIDFDLLEEISSSWLFEKVSKEEMSFLLRPLEKHHLLKDDRRLFLLSSPKGVFGFIELVPIYLGKSVIGYYADIIRVRSDSPAGSVNFFLLEVMNAVFLEEKEVFSLGLSPFHKVSKVYADFGSKRKRVDNSFVTSIFKNTFSYGNFLYNAKGQAFHKEKFRADMQKTYYCTKKRFPVFEILGGFTISGISIWGQIFGSLKKKK